MMKTPTKKLNAIGISESNLLHVCAGNNVCLVPSHSLGFDFDQLEISVESVESVGTTYIYRET